MSGRLEDSDKRLIFLGISLIAVVVLIAIFGYSLNESSQKYAESEQVKTDTIPELMNILNGRDIVIEATPIKGNLNLGEQSSLYNELPDISTYDVMVRGNGDIDIEIFTSGEKAGKDNDRWLIELGEKFNSSGVTLKNGKSVSMTVRSVPSGTAADYIIADKQVPDLYAPSSVIFAEYANANGASLHLYNERLVGNTAGILVSKDYDYKTIDEVINAVMSGEFNLGYTNPQVAATGINLLIEILNSFGEGDINSQEAINAFVNFSNNIPYVAYHAQQMLASVSSGTLDGMVSEYQAYINKADVKEAYNFIPYGVRHDNPLYVVDYENKSQDELDAIKIINDFLMSPESQFLATDLGFNALDSYADSYSITGTDVIKAFKIYDDNKDAGKDVIAVFCLDCSGSMDGDPINEVKNSLTNGMNYIKDNNFIGMVSFSSKVTIELPIAQFDLSQKAYFQGAIDNLSAAGATSTYEALTVACNMIEEESKNHNNAKKMIFLLSDGCADGEFSLDTIRKAVISTGIPIYTISYTNEADKEALRELADLNEAISIDSDTDDIVYQLRNLFNAQL